MAAAPCGTVLLSVCVLACRAREGQLKRRRGPGGRTQRKGGGFEKGRGKGNGGTTRRKRPRGKEKEGPQPKRVKCVSPADEVEMEGGGRVRTGRNVRKLLRKKRGPGSESCVLVAKAKELWEKLRRCVCAYVYACVCVCMCAQLI